MILTLRSTILSATFWWLDVWSLVRETAVPTADVKSFLQLLRLTELLTTIFRLSTWRGERVLVIRWLALLSVAIG